MPDEMRGEEMTVYEKYQLLTDENKQKVTRQIETLIVCQSCPQ